MLWVKVYVFDTPRAVWTSERIEFKVLFSFFQKNSAQEKDISILS